MNTLPDLHFVSWSDFHTIGFKLSQKLQQERPHIETMVSVSRGGHVLARILSDFLKLPIFSVSIQSYTSIQQQGELHITQELAVDLQGKHVLLVDEVVDSGKTLERALEYLDTFKVASITSVAAHVNYHASCESDYFIEKTAKWIVYPYEVRETWEALLPIYLEAGKTKQDLLEVLIAGGINRQFLEESEFLNTN